MTSASPGVTQWRATFLTLRDETLISPAAAALAALLRRLLLPSDSLLSAAELLPSHEVTSDVILLAELILSVSKCEDCEDVVYNISHLIHEIMCKVRLEINPTCWNTLLNFLEAILGRLEKNCSIKSNKIGTIKDSLDIISVLHRGYERNASLSENMHLIKVIICLISLLHNELIKSNQSLSLWDMQNSAFSILGKVLNRVGPNISQDLWQSIVEVLRKLMDFLASNNLILENNIMSRFYTSFLQCLHLILSEPKGLISGHMAGFVSTLQLFFTYGLNSAPQNPDSKSKEIQFSNLGMNCKSNRSNNAYKPPHLRRKEGLNNNYDNKNNNYNYNGNYSDSESGSRYDCSSSDSDLSDSDYSKINDRFKSSKIRLNAIFCIQDLCRADGKSLTSFWPLLLPENDVLQLRKNQATLMTTLIFDPTPKVRIEAVQTIGTMVETQTFVLSQVAEFKEYSKPGSFTTLSSSLGKILMQLHTGVLYLVKRETHNSLVNALFKLLIILISATPYGRMPGELLPNVISSLCNRISENNAIKHDHYTFVVNVLSCLEIAFSKSPPSLDVLKLLQEDISHEFSQVEGKSCVFSILFNCSQKDMHLSIKCGTLQVLRAILHNYPSVANATWRKVSDAVNELLQIKYSEDFHFGPSKSDNDKNAPPTLERCITSAIKVMDECLRAVSGFQGADDRPESNSRFSDLTRNKRVSSAPCFELQQTLNNHNINNNNSINNSNNLSQIDGIVIQADSDGFIVWSEAIEEYLPLALSHSSSMVRAVSVTCFAGLTLNVFSSFSEQKKEFVISNSIFAATKDATPSVRSAACRAVGIISSFPQIISDSRVLSDFIHAVELNTRNSLASVRITASWALANICDSLRLKSDELPESGELSKLTSLLVETALRLTKDGDKIKSNAVRALGYLARFMRFDNSNGNSNWLERMVQAFLSCVTTGNVKVQWNVCHALSNLFINNTLKLQSMPWAPTVYRILMLLIRDSTNYKIRIHATIALAVPSCKIDYGSSYSDVVQGIIHVLELLSNSDNNNSAPSSFKYKENLEKQLAFTALHLLSFVSSDDEPSLKDFLIKKANFLEEWLKLLCKSLKEGLNLNQPSSGDNSNSEEIESETQPYLMNKSILLKSIKALLNLFQSTRHQIIANKFEKLVKSLL